MNVSNQVESKTLKSGERKRVTFGEVVRQCKESVDRDNNPYERYIEGGHMETENIHIRRWDEFGEDYVGPAFHRIFRKGQVLYGSRRTYLKKVAFAEFDGITANTTFVCETRDSKILLPELLPFLMLTDSFTEHSIRESKGSTNPYINWPDIAKYKFTLPPIKEQKRIAEILWAADKGMEAFLESELELRRLMEKDASSFLSKDWKLEPLAELLTTIQYGSSKKIVKAEPETVPVLRIPNVIGGQICLNDLGYTHISEAEKQSYRLNINDVLIVRTNGNPNYVGRTAVVGHGVPSDCIYASYLIRLQCDRNRLLPEYLHSALSANRMRRTLKHEIRSSAGNYNLNTKGIKRQKLPLPSIEEQAVFVKQRKSYLAKSKELLKHLSLLADLKRSLLNTALGAEHV